MTLPLMATMIAYGLWYRLTLMFVLSGLWHGSALAAHQNWSRHVRPHLPAALCAHLGAWAVIVSMAAVMPGMRAAGSCRVQQAVVYKRRRPERSVASLVVHQSLETWSARRRAGGLDAGSGVVP